MSSEGKFTGKVAIVTGGCRGIGRGIVDVLVENGGKVAVFDINDKEGEQLKPSGSGEVFYIHCDVSQEYDVKKAIEKTIQTFGKLDCLVNNAGWHPPTKSIDEFTLSEFKSLLDLNLIGVFLNCKYALSYLRQTKGNIINISSAVTKHGQAGATTYCATKGGITAMSRALALDEAQHDVRVNV